MTLEAETNNSKDPIDEENSDKRIIPWARFCARQFDLYFVCFLWIIPINFAFGSGSDYSYVLAQHLMVSPFIYIFFEPFCISLWGTTPGKFLYGIRVLNKDSSKLSIKKSIKRSLQVYIRGMAFVLPIFSSIANYIAYRDYKNKKSTPWDRNLKINYLIGDISNKRILITNIIILILAYSIRNSASIIKLLLLK